MTRARALKHTIRARAAKTGERYTTARRHVLRELNQRSEPATASAFAQGASADKKAVALQTKPAASSKPTMSDASVLKKTGHDLAHWFGVLDRFRAVEK